MKKKLLFLLVFSMLATFSQAQEGTVSGKVTSEENGEPIPGVNVVLKGTTIGTITDVDGRYQLKVPNTKGVLTFSFIGLISSEVPIANQTTINAKMSADVKQLSEVVVTALGISREKRALGYGTQEVSGDELNKVQTDNFANSLSGKVAGVSIKRNNNMGGSTNVVIRGNSSLTNNNQALFVVDGVPISNINTNSSSQSQAGSGYDYGNAASDIDPNSIESVNVLKGAAATALYGSRAANGVVMITTKKGTAKKGVGITLNSGVTLGTIDKRTFPKYQDQYGAGYGGNDWLKGDINGDGEDDLIGNIGDDASYGPAFDKDLLVYQWNAFDPESPYFGQRTPWVSAGDNGAASFFETAVTLSNNIAITGGSDAVNYRLSYTNFDQKGILPNSELKRNNFNINLSAKVSERLTATGMANFIRTTGLGRNSTGYNDNIMGMFRQWWQTNVDVQQQKEAYFNTGRNATWNYKAYDKLVPIYWDNPYWTRYENFQNDERNRIIGNIALNYQLTDGLSLYGRITADTYRELQEERRAVGSVPNAFGVGGGSDGSIGRVNAGSGYQRRDIAFSEYNYDLMLNFDKDLSRDFSLKGVLGMNIRRNYFESSLASTNGGLNVEGLYSLQNSVGPLAYPKERDEKIGVNGIYGSFSVGYKNYLFLDGTLRRDQSSTLPTANNSYYYPSIASSLVFTELVEIPAVSFGKVRLNYAQVGNDAQFDLIRDTYDVSQAFNGANTSIANTKKNPELRPEETKSIEAGLEMFFLNRRVGLDLGVYKTNSIDQIVPIRVSESTGYRFKVINAGEIENKGIELSLSGTPIQKENFEWNVNVNWTKNVNEVVSLGEGIENLQLGSFQGGVTLNAALGQPYGVIYGTDYTYHENGSRIINPDNGRYIVTGSSDNAIGNVNPDYLMGITNSFTYKNVSLGFLIDIQKGGDLFSLDMYYGQATGLYEETAFINDLGNPVRNALSEGGGLINEGVNPDGTVNTTRLAADEFGGQGYSSGLPNKAFIYDAGYVKLREVTLSYNFPQTLMEKTPLTGASLSFVGSNLWIIHKNLPHADPESGLGSGNLQGYSTGSLPTTRNFGFNVKLQF